MKALNNVLNKSAKALISYQDMMTGLDEKSSLAGTPEASLSDLLSILTNAKVQLSREVLSKEVIHINPKTMKAIEEALDLLLKDPTTQNKVNAVQLILFGTNTPFWSVLRDMQNLLRVLKQLDEARGIKVTKTEKSGGL